MPDVVNVSWPGQHIAEDTTHRLVTDAQIERWNRINNISGDDQYIELTPSNISQYTCTKPDEYWTDMGLADGTIFDSSSLDEGNYIIKLGMDKLQKMPSVSHPLFRFGKDGYTYDDYLKKELEYNNGNMTEEEFEAYKKALEESLGYQTYVNYTIETQTFLFLCMFFGQELSLADLLAYIEKNYACEFILSTKLTDIYVNSRTLIKWPEAIRIKIIKEQYGSENNMYVLKRYIFFDMNIVDYSNCYNYKYDGEGGIEEASLTDEDYGIATLAVDQEGNESPYKDSSWVECDFTGVPIRTITKGKSAVPYYTTTLSSKTAREYIVQSQLGGKKSWNHDLEKYLPNICESYDAIHVAPNYSLYTDSFYGNDFTRYINETIIDEGGIRLVNNDIMQRMNYEDGSYCFSSYAQLSYDELYFERQGFFNEDEYNSINYNTQTYISHDGSINILQYDDNNNRTDITMSVDEGFIYEPADDEDDVYYEFGIYNYGIFCWRTVVDIEKGTSRKYRAGISSDGIIYGEFNHPLTIKLNDTTTYTYNNTEDVTVDLSELGTKNTKVTNWDTALTPGHYYSDLDATNAPYNTLSGSLQGPGVNIKKETFGFCGTVERIGDNLVIQHLYSGTNCDMNQYIRKGVSTSNDTFIHEEDVDNDGWIFGEWYCVEFSTGSSEACAPFGSKYSEME